ncbi:Amino-acid biosynthesis, amino-acid transport [Planctomycetales bacterium 10988]|nr:Amino-acid biosynthesis, amino-acid transport [Planctomycetales bacterium 10988]
MLRTLKKITGCTAVLLGMCLVSGDAANGQLFQAEKPDLGPQLADEQVTQMQLGMVVQAKTACRGLLGTIPVPLDWPEQQVRLVSEDVSPGVNISYRQITPTVKQMLVSIPYLPTGMEAKALVTVELTRHTMLPPDDPSKLQVPKRLSMDLRKYIGSSPGINPRHNRIRTISRQITRDIDNDYEQIKAIYEWVRENVEYVNGPFKGDVAALEDGEGDCEELSSLFISLCRANMIPARTVWVPGHCYPEFYMEDEHGTGYWLPCQAAGGYAFGGIPEYRPILQKGDNFKVPERPRDVQRYVAEFLTGKGGRPSVEFIRDILGYDEAGRGLSSNTNNSPFSQTQ